MHSVHIGCGAGFAGDRIDAAWPVIEHLKTCDVPRYLIFEVLAERTLALAQSDKLDDPSRGYSPFLDLYLTAILADCKRHNIRIVTNMGAANPQGAAQRIRQIAIDQGIDGLRIATVTGDDLLAYMPPDDVRALPAFGGEAELNDAGLIAANVYLGARPISQALSHAPDIVIVGRTTDAALSLGPLIHEFDWQEDDLDRLASGTLTGHLLECGAQVTGGYFADPGFKDAPDLANVGFPIAAVAEDGTIEITKPAGTGGLVTRATVIEQILYEMHDPANYLTPDVTLDLIDVTADETRDNVVQISGARGTARPDTLKALLSFDAGWLGETALSYAGPNCFERASLAGDIVAGRMAEIHPGTTVQIDILGSGAMHRQDTPHKDAPEYRVRAALRSRDKAIAERLTLEMLSLYCSGPAGGGGFRKAVTRSVETASVHVERTIVEPHIKVEVIET